MPLTNKLKTDYIELFDKWLYFFPNDSTIDIRQPLIHELEALLKLSEQMWSIPNDSRFKEMLEPIIEFHNEPWMYVQDHNDYREFKNLLKERIQSAIQYLKVSTDEVLKGFIKPQLWVLSN